MGLDWDKHFTLILYSFVILCNSFVLINVIFPPIQIANSFDTPSNPWLDFTSIFTDVGVFIITGFLAVIAYYIRQYFVNNSKWKEEREKFESQQANTNERISNAIKLIVDDLKSEKEARSKEIDEIKTDFKLINHKSIVNETNIISIKETIADLRRSSSNSNQ